MATPGRMNGFRRTLLGALLLSSTALAAPAGTLYITDHQVDTKTDGWEKEAKKGNRASLDKSGDGWRLYFVAWLKRAPGVDSVHLVFYEMDASKKDPVNNFEIGTQPTAKILMSDLTVGSEGGLKPGKYRVLITTLIKGREEVLARTNLELK